MKKVRISSCNRKGLGMWVMSKTVLFIFLLLLVVIMTSFLNIYQHKVVEDSARSVIMLWAESANSVMQFRSSSAVWPLNTQIEIRSAGGSISEARDYTVGIKKVKDGNERLVFMLAWGDHNETKVDGITKYATAVSVALPSDITHVYFFNGSLSPGQPPKYVSDKETVVRPSIGGSRDAYIVFYRNQTVLCVGTIKQTEKDLANSINSLSSCCNNPASCP